MWRLVELIVELSFMFALFRWLQLIPPVRQWWRQRRSPGLRLIQGGGQTSPDHIDRPAA